MSRPIHIDGPAWTGCPTSPKAVRVEWRWENGDRGVVELAVGRWSNQPLYGWHFQHLEYGVGSNSDKPIEFSKAIRRVFDERRQQLGKETNMRQRRVGAMPRLGVIGFPASFWRR